MHDWLDCGAFDCAAGWIDLAELGAAMPKSGGVMFSCWKDSGAKNGAADGFPVHLAVHVERADGNRLRFYRA